MSQSVDERNQTGKGASAQQIRGVTRLIAAPLMTTNRSRSRSCCAEPVPEPAAAPLNVLRKTPRARPSCKQKDERESGAYQRCPDARTGFSNWSHSFHGYTSGAARLAATG